MTFGEGYGWYNPGVPDLLNQVVYLLDQKPSSESCLVEMLEMWYNSLYSELFVSNNFECCPSEPSSGFAELLTELLAELVFSEAQTILVEVISSALIPLGRRDALQGVTELARLLRANIRQNT